MKPTKIYNNVINQMLSENIEIKAMSHITGGGIPENLPRCIPSDFIPYINTSSWELPILFKFLNFLDVPFLKTILFLIFELNIKGPSYLN